MNHFISHKNLHRVPNTRATPFDAQAQAADVDTKESDKKAWEVITTHSVSVLLAGSCPWTANWIRYTELGGMEARRKLFKVRVTVEFVGSHMALECTTLVEGAMGVSVLRSNSGETRGRLEVS